MGFLDGTPNVGAAALVLERLPRHVEAQAVEKSSTTNVLFKIEHVLEEELQINKGDEKEWKYKLMFPDDVPPTYLAKYFTVKWEIKASLKPIVRAFLSIRGQISSFLIRSEYPFGKASQ